MLLRLVFEGISGGERGSKALCGAPGLAFELQRDAREVHVECHFGFRLSGPQSGKSVGL